MKIGEIWENKNRIPASFKILEALTNTCIVDCFYNDPSRNNIQIITNDKILFNYQLKEIK